MTLVHWETQVQITDLVNKVNKEAILYI